MRSTSHTWTDQRISLIEKILKGIEEIRKSSLETSISATIKHLRNQELNSISKVTLLTALLRALSLFTAKLSVVTTILLFSYSESEIPTARKVFVVLLYLHFLSQSLLQNWPDATCRVIEMVNALNCLDKFLSHPETKEELLERKNLEINKRHDEEELLLKQRTAQIVHTIGGMHIGSRLADRDGNANYNRVMIRRCVNETTEKKGIVLEGATAMWTRNGGREKRLGK